MVPPIPLNKGVLGLRTKGPPYPWGPYCRAHIGGHFRRGGVRMCVAWYWGTGPVRNRSGMALTSVHALPAYLVSFSNRFVHSFKTRLSLSGMVGWLVGGGGGVVGACTAHGEARSNAGTNDC